MNASRLPAVVLIAIAVCPGLSYARQHDDWRQRTTLTGDWNGVRTRWDQAGVAITASYGSESAGNTSGGRTQTARYTQHLQLGAMLDLGKLMGITGGKFQIVMTDRKGRSLSADAIGNIFPVQQLYGAGQNFRLAEFNYQQSLRDNSINLEIGWSPIGDSFAQNPYACHFQNNALCGKPIGLGQDSGGARHFPVAQWGGRVRVNLAPEFYATTGAYLVNPKLGDRDHGWTLGFNHTGVLIPLELGWTPRHGLRGLPGQYRLGIYRNTADSPDVFRDINGNSAGRTRMPFAVHSSRNGMYLMGMQTLWRSASDPARAVHAFATYAKGDADVAQFGNSWEVGTVWDVPIATRPHDYLAVAYASAQINPGTTRFQRDRNLVAPGSIAVQSYERIAEADYNVQVAPWLSLRPNLQYVIRPGATGRIPDAFVIGLATLVTF